MKKLIKPLCLLTGLLCAPAVLLHAQVDEKLKADIVKHIGLNKTARETVHGGAARHFARSIETRDLFAFPVKHFTGIVHMQTAVAVVKRDGSPRRIERPFLNLVLGLDRKSVV